MENEILFEEKQRLGFNNFTLMFRLALAAFCYVAYYFTDDREINGDLLLWIGNIILIISILMFFVIHLHTNVMNGFVELIKMILPIHNRRSPLVSLSSVK